MDARVETMLSWYGHAIEENVERKVLNMNVCNKSVYNEMAKNGENTESASRKVWKTKTCCIAP